MILDVITYPNDRLRLKSEEVTEFDSSLHELLDNMYDTMKKEQGVGLAAIQVNVPKRVLITNIPDDKEEYDDTEKMEFINPKIIKKSGEVVEKEGCLSVPNFFEEVTRYDEIVVRFQDRFGEEYEMETNGYFAVIIQHELDHLNGILFVDRLSAFKKKRFQKEFEKNQNSK